MNIVIEAVNIRAGGGVTHLVEVLNAVDLEKSGINRIDVWAPCKTLKQIHPKDGLRLRSHHWMDAGLKERFLFKRWFERELRGNQHIDLLWVPSGVYHGSFRPYVTMAQNLLPFDAKERARYGLSFTRLRLRCLHHMQLRSFRNAQGIIFVSEAAQESVCRFGLPESVTKQVVHHGINSRFLMKPREQRAPTEFTKDKPLRLLYVSIVNLYKHQDKLVEAVALLRARGLHVCLDLVGPAYPPALAKLNKAIQKFDPEKSFVNYHGKIPYGEIEHFYQCADIYVCNSSCETFGMILLEAMGAGLPVVCSNIKAFQEIAEDASLFADCEKPEDIAQQIELLVSSREMRTCYANKAFERAQQFSWEKCADETFAFLMKCANPYRNES